MAEEPKKSSGKSCLLIGCLGIVALGIIVLAVGYFGTRYMINNAIDTYTSTNSVTLGSVEISDEEYADLEERVNQFRQALETQGESYELVLTDREINAYIARDPDLEEIEDKVFVKIEGDSIKSDVSFPLDQFSGFPMLGRLEGRYFNGSATLRVSLEDAYLNVRLAGASIDGESLPDQAIQQLSQQNLAKDIYNDPKSREAIRKLESIKVEDGKVHISVRANKPTGESSGTNAPPVAEEELETTTP